MLIDKVLSVKEKKQIFARIEQGWLQVGIKSRTEFVDAVHHNGSRLTLKSLAAYAAGRSMPNMDRMIAIAKTIKRTIDYILIGVEPTTC
jgi:hypothetical protein